LQADGTSDPGGGGIINVSSEEQVLAAIERTRRFVISKKGYLLFYKYLPEAYGAKKESTAPFRSLLRKIAAPRDWSAANDPLHPLPHLNIESYLSLSPLVMMTKDTAEKNCAPKSYNQYPDAYASSFSYGATICFNIQHLRRLTPDNLFNQLLALWAHELCHLNGCSESQADALDDYVIDSLNKLHQPTTLYSLKSMTSILRLTIYEYMAFYVSLERNGAPISTFNRKSIRSIAVYLAALVAQNEMILNLPAVYSADDSMPLIGDPTIKYVHQLGQTQEVVASVANDFNHRGVISNRSPQVLIIASQLGCLTKRFKELGQELGLDETVMQETLSLGDQMMQRTLMQTVSCPNWK
jgi:hypothetical protein